MFTESKILGLKWTSMELTIRGFSDRFIWGALAKVSANSWINSSIGELI